MIGKWLDAVPNNVNLMDEKNEFPTLLVDNQDIYPSYSNTMHCALDYDLLILYSLVWFIMDSWL
jgi:hypothetical protein